MKIIVVHPAHMDYRQEIFESLNKKYDTTFIFTKQGRGQEGVKEEQASIPPEWKSKVLKSDFLIGRKDIAMYLRLIKELLFGKYDLILTSTNWYICWIMAKVRGKKFVFMTEFWHWQDTSFIRKILNRFTKVVVKNSDSIFVMGTNAYRSCIELGIKEERVFMHPQCAMDYSEFPTFNLRTKHNLENKKIILFLGRIVNIKGLDYLIESFSRLEYDETDAFLIIAGEGPERTKYEKLAKERGIKNILFTGRVLKKDISSYYSACDIFVLPSIFYKQSYEPWGLVINEAMAFSKPVIATNAVGASADMIKNGYNGYVVKEKNVDKLYNSLKNVLANDENMKLMGKNSRTIFEIKNNYGSFSETLSLSLEHAIK
ncbi:MAG: glycosyltransferase family 4 protein [Methanosarcina sp.]|uniref:glycosyltransferase family 4 protein n=1 Tax=Methanosarcina sp. TaxID=2213 RepID=UPI002608A5A6|nr:glycosyltransferase family 4 protein [Methanosarcina sp.]MDD3245963.1 glycosyltransferase family 4 protein [Methanosarcina sp.]MDD4247607.1 glycosyltransferase family 4 protein [Methanosarcina sp.]